MAIHPWRRIHWWAHRRVEMSDFRAGPPHEPVVVAHVAIADAPAVVEALHEEGFSARYDEPGEADEALIKVPRGEADAAQALLERRRAEM